MPQLKFFNSGNADTTLITLDNKRRILVDYANRAEEYTKYCDLPGLLKKELEDAKVDFLDVVAFTHADTDHTKGAEDFFHFESNANHQDEGRIKIKELWVPAGFIFESRNDLGPSAKAIQAEARYRLLAGQGIRVFSKPECLEDWLKARGKNLADFRSCMTDAGQLAPGFTLEQDGVEFFIHNPMASTLDAGADFFRNEEALVFQATFQVLQRLTRVLFMSDVNADTIETIVDTTEVHGNGDRLTWDIMKISHHCSYKSLNCEDKGTSKTVPLDQVKNLLEKYGQSGAILVSTSDVIPTQESVQPPHFQARAYYLDVKDLHQGEWCVTQEHPSSVKPEPLVIDISQNGGMVIQAGITGSATSKTTSQPAPRAGGK